MATSKTVASAPPSKAPAKSAAKKKAPEPKTKKAAPPSSKRGSSVMKPPVSPVGGGMSPQQRTALAQGREETRVVSAYLEALRANKPKRGRQRTRESITKRIEAIQGSLDSVSAIDQLQMIQEMADLQEELNELASAEQITELESEFVKVAKSYGDRKGITRSTWRRMDVPNDVLAAAGIR
jgi:hypothetical protein